MATASTNGGSLNDYICGMLYSRKKKKAQEGTKVQGDPKKKKVTKESVFNDTKARFEKEFPNVAIPDSTLRGYSMVYLLSGLREDAMTKMIEKEKERQKNEGGS